MPNATERFKKCDPVNSRCVESGNRKKCFFLGVWVWMGANSTLISAPIRKAYNPLKQKRPLGFQKFLNSLGFRNSSRISAERSACSLTQF